MIILPILSEKVIYYLKNAYKIYEYFFSNSKKSFHIKHERTSYEGRESFIIFYY